MNTQETKKPDTGASILITYRDLSTYETNYRGGGWFPTIQAARDYLWEQMEREKVSPIEDYLSAWDSWLDGSMWVPAPDITFTGNQLTIDRHTDVEIYDIIPYDEKAVLFEELPF